MRRAFLLATLLLLAVLPSAGAIVSPVSGIVFTSACGAPSTTVLVSLASVNCIGVGAWGGQRSCSARPDGLYDCRVDAGGYAYGARWINSGSFTITAMPCGQSESIAWDGPTLITPEGWAGCTSHATLAAGQCAQPQVDFTVVATGERAPAPISSWIRSNICA